MKKFVKIEYTNFKSLMDSMGFEEIKVDNTFERVWIFHINNTNFQIRILSTICLNTNQTRPSGTDAIRCIIYDTRENKLVKLEKRVNRTSSALINTRSRCRELYKYVKTNICCNCGGLLVIRNSKYNHKFMGCSNFPICKYSKNIIKPQLTLKF